MMERLKVLPDADLEKIHNASLQILTNTGISLSDPVGVELLTSAGAIFSRGRVFIPPELVSQALEDCPSRVNISGRDGKTFTIGDGTLGWHNLGGARDVYEPELKKKRPAQIWDVQAAARLLDALPSATTVTPFFTPQDVPGHTMSLAMYRYSLPFTKKPLQGPGVQNAQEVYYMVRMAEVIGKPEENLTLSVSPISPLRFPDDAVQSIIAIARAGVPFGSLPCPTAGTTAPITLAGSIVQQNAEVLASIVLAQISKPELPVIYCGRLAMMEPHTGLSVWGGMETGLAAAATVQMAHFYNLPVNVYGFSTNSHHFEIQNGFERAVNALLPALAGADELSGIGEMEAGVMGSFAQMVVDDEIAAGIERVLRGIVVDEDTLGIRVIDAVINEMGNFLIEPHTSKYLRKGEMYVTRLAERGTWETWERKGFQDMADRAQQQAIELIAKHEVPPLDDIQEKELNSILSTAERNLPI
jgi:trimethylamine---corrinoid protein Co-methyltransferase